MNRLDTEIRLLLPEKDVPSPDLSIVVPALNEQANVAEFVRWCLEGIAEAGVAAEILIVDSSTDQTPELALAAGARVLKTPKRGLGRAYIDSLPYIRGRWVVMGDCDCTYDFRHLKPFVEKFKAGFEFVMGSRFAGYIEPGAMPPLHQYFGTPVTTLMLNIIFGSRFSDIHCGMRGMTTEALKRMSLKSQSWEYASEIVVKSVQLDLRTAEVPIRFLKDRNGRVSHHLRSGWLSPWLAGWINLRVMFIYGANFFLFKPGVLMLVAGLALTIPLLTGPVVVGKIVLAVYSKLLGLSVSVVGLQSCFLGILVQALHDHDGSVTRRWLRIFPYNRTTALSAAAFVTGLGLIPFLVREFVKSGYRLSRHDPAAYLALTGLQLMIMAFMTFAFTLLLHGIAVERGSSA